MRKHVLALALAGTAMVATAQNGDVTVWKRDALLKQSQDLPKKFDAYKSASDSLGTVGNRSFILARREGNGQAEWHADMADIMTILSGKCTLIYGGEVVNGKDTAPGEKRGDSIKGGKEVTLGPGDVFHIPAKVPHQMKVSGVMTYFVAKVKE